MLPPTEAGGILHIRGLGELERRRGAPPSFGGISVNGSPRRSCVTVTGCCTRFDGFDDKILLLYARGMSTLEILGGR